MLAILHNHVIRQHISCLGSTKKYRVHRQSVVEKNEYRNLEPGANHDQKVDHEMSI